MYNNVIAGNWKTNGSKSELNQWFADFQTKLDENKNLDKNSLILIAVPDILIPYAVEKATEFNKKNALKISISAQNIHQKEKGAFTGNNSVLFLKDFACEITLVGHSERREYQKETDEEIAEKANLAIKNAVLPIICVGESLEIREGGKYLEFIKNQVLNSVKDVDLTKAIVAYEPVWAIGTGKVPSIQDIDEVNSFIKKELTKITGIAEDKLKVLYGGSVKSSNVAEITGLNSVDGVLVGGASLKGEEFFNIFLNSK